MLSPLASGLPLEPAGGLVIDRRCRRFDRIIELNPDNVGGGGPRKDLLRRVVIIYPRTRESEALLFFLYFLFFFFSFTVTIFGFTIRAEHTDGSATTIRRTRRHGRFQTKR